MYILTLSSPIIGEIVDLFVDIEQNSTKIMQLTTKLIGVAILFIFTILVLKVDYGNNLPLIILLACFGSFAGLSLGIAVATLFKVNENE